jgi:hypothetical protein
MHAAVGDQVVVKSRHIGEHERLCTILEVRGSDGGPPYVVRWNADGHEGLFFPGPDVQLMPAQSGS